MSRWLLALALSASLSCDQIIAPCEAIERPGIALTIVDSVTQGPVLVDSIFATAVDGAYTHTERFTNIRPDPVTVVLLGMEREGAYDVEVIATGYRTWERKGIRVTGGRCHVNTVNVTAAMQRLTN